MSFSLALSLRAQHISLSLTLQCWLTTENSNHNTRASFETKHLPDSCQGASVFTTVFAMSHTTSAHTALAGTRLCTGCEKMRIDDKACGGFVRMHDAETPVLAFPEESVNGWRAGVLKLLMGQERDELLPGFSYLARSAAAGCQFCRFIHTSFLQASRSIKGLQIHGRATLRMAYHWGRRSVRDDRDGLQAFVATVFGPDGKKAAALHFGIYAAHPGPGTC